MTDEERKALEEDAARQAAVAQDAFEEATWDAIERYRATGDLVPVMQDGRLELLTVAEALRSRRDYDKRRDQTGRRKCDALLGQFASLGREIPADLWERLAADRKTQYEDELRWIDMAREAAAKQSSPAPSAPAESPAHPATKPPPC